MSNKTQINEIFAFLAKNNEIQPQRLSQIYSNTYRSMGNAQSTPNNQNSPVSNSILKPLTKVQFEGKLSQTLSQKNIDEELLLLFYNLDRDKKGYLSPEDIVAAFNTIEKSISLNEIENSFKYVKVYKNKMTFEDFKEYFYNF